MIDFEKLKNQFMGEFAIFAEVAKSYFGNRKLREAELKAAIESENREGIHRSAHALKGVVSMFQDEAVTQLCLKIEKEAKTASMVELKVELAKLQPQLQNLTAEIEQLIKKNSF